MALQARAIFFQLFLPDRSRRCTMAVDRLIPVVNTYLHAKHLLDQYHAVVSCEGRKWLENRIFVFS